MKFPTNNKIAEIFKIAPPLQNIKITQPFGANEVPFYKELGMKGHNGIDYRARTGTKCYSCFNGTVFLSGVDSGGGVFVKIDSDPFFVDGVRIKLRSVHYHLDSFVVMSGQRVMSGQLIGYTGNSGKYTTAAHLHLGIKPYIEANPGIWIKDSGNGYFGAIDHAPLMNQEFIEAGQSEAYKRYGKPRNYILDYTFRFANYLPGILHTNFLKKRVKDARYVHERLYKIGRRPPLLTTEEANAIIYGGWDLNTVLEPAMYQTWSQKTKY